MATRSSKFRWVVNQVLELLKYHRLKQGNLKRIDRLPPYELSVDIISTALIRFTRLAPRTISNDGLYWHVRAFGLNDERIKTFLLYQTLKFQSTRKPQSQQIVLLNGEANHRYTR